VLTNSKRCRGRLNKGVHLPPEYPTQVVEPHGELVFETWGSTSISTRRPRGEGRRSPVLIWRNSGHMLFPTPVLQRQQDVQDSLLSVEKSMMLLDIAPSPDRQAFEAKVAADKRQWLLEAAVVAPRRPEAALKPHSVIGHGQCTLWRAAYSLSAERALAVSEVWVIWSLWSRVRSPVESPQAWVWSNRLVESGESHLNSF
jgi:hypothetical protein